MSELHLIEAPLDLRALHIWAETRGFAGRGRLDEGRALHHLLGETFGPGAVQPFRVLVAPRKRHGSLYGYSAQDEHALREQARATATPASADVLPPESVRSKPRPSNTWQTGQRLGFDLRLRPVVRLRGAINGTVFKPGSELDAFVAEALQNHGNDTDGMEKAGRSREAVYLDWLATRLGASATLEQDATHLVSFQRSRVQRGQRWQEGPDAVIHGTLSVTDPAAFADRLARGVGRHRAYGYGMLLLRPPQRC